MPLSDAEVRRVGWLAVAMGAFALVYYLAPVPTPFFVAAILACIFQPLVLWLGRHRLPRTLAVALPASAVLLVALRKLRTRCLGSDLYPVSGRK